MEKIFPLSGRGKEIFYEVVNNIRNVKWGSTKFNLSDSVIDDILENFFLETNKWYPLGADEVNPMFRGLGRYLELKYQKELTPRYASAIAAIMYHEGFIEYRNKRPILLKKVER